MRGMQFNPTTPPPKRVPIPGRAGVAQIVPDLFVDPDGRVVPEPKGIPHFKGVLPFTFTYTNNTAQELDLGTKTFLDTNRAIAKHGSITETNAKWLFMPVGFNIRCADSSFRGADVDLQNDLRAGTYLNITDVDKVEHHIDLRDAYDPGIMLTTGTTLAEDFALEGGSQRLPYTVISNLAEAKTKLILPAVDLDGGGATAHTYWLDIYGVWVPHSAAWVKKLKESGIITGAGVACKKG